MERSPNSPQKSNQRVVLLVQRSDRRNDRSCFPWVDVSEHPTVVKPDVDVLDPDKVSSGEILDG